MGGADRLRCRHRLRPPERAGTGVTIRVPLYRPGRRRHRDLGAGEEYSSLRSARRGRRPTGRQQWKAGDRGGGRRRRPRDPRHRAGDAGRVLHLRRSGPGPAGYAATDGRVRDYVRLRQRYDGDGPKMEAVRTGLIEWAVAELARAGQNESGDSYLATTTTDGALVAVVTGLGDGANTAVRGEGDVMR